MSLNITRNALYSFFTIISNETIGKFVIVAHESSPDFCCTACVLSNTEGWPKLSLCEWCTRNFHVCSAIYIHYRGHNCTSFWSWSSRSYLSMLFFSRHESMSAQAHCKFQPYPSYLWITLTADARLRQQMSWGDSEGLLNWQAYPDTTECWIQDFLANET